MTLYHHANMPPCHATLPCHHAMPPCHATMPCHRATMLCHHATMTSLPTSCVHTGLFGNSGSQVAWASGVGVEVGSVRGTAIGWHGQRWPFTTPAWTCFSPAFISCVALVPVCCWWLGGCLCFVREGRSWRLPQPVLVFGGSALLGAVCSVGGKLWDPTSFSHHAADHYPSFYPHHLSREFAFVSHHIQHASGTGTAIYRESWRAQSALAAYHHAMFKTGN